MSQLRLRASGSVFVAVARGGICAAVALKPAPADTFDGFEEVRRASCEGARDRFARWSKLLVEFEIGDALGYPQTYVGDHGRLLCTRVTG